MCFWCYYECISTPDKLKNLRDFCGKRTRDFWFATLKVAGSKAAGSTAVVRQILQFARCGYTLRVTPQTQGLDSKVHIGRLV